MMKIRKTQWQSSVFVGAVVFMYVLVLQDVVAISEDVLTPVAMSKDEKEQLKEESREMFYHAYRAYMDNAYPADELMPLSCAGRYRGITANRGDMDDILGNFSLTLVDTLDSLVILGDFEEFEHAVKLVINDVSFDSDIVVSVFETNIRMLGGLLSAHVLTEYLQHRDGIMLWYEGELLNMAKDLGYRLLPAFNTTTGIPHARINLRHGMKVERLQSSRETCTACAGTMVLEMAALSRLTGEPIFEAKAHRAMDELWKMRHRSSDLMGTVLNIHSGDWVRRDSGVGAGIDSYYEYCLKAYILLGEDRYLNRFNRHYTAVMKYISQGPMLLDVHMHRPHTNSRNFMDALLAFWPGLQVLMGDLKPAVETHEMLYQVMQRHTFIPEAFTMDFQVHWGQHPLRPEFLESTYFLYKATQDPHYLEVGKKVLRSLQKHARVACGFAAVNDVRTGKHEDRMDSFVLAETFKYLFLLFSEQADLVLDLDEFIFTTEAHLLPLSLGSYNDNGTIVTVRDSEEDSGETEYSRTCPTTVTLFPESVRLPLQNLVSGQCHRRGSLSTRRLRAQDFQTSNPEHLKIVREMGISMLSLSDGRVQLLHTFSGARTPADAEEGLLFMQEMVELSKAQAQTPDAMPQAVLFPVTDSDGSTRQVMISAGPSHFGPELRGSQRVTARITIADPFRVCSALLNPDQINGHIVIMERGDCMFVDKARRVQAAGAVAAIVVDNAPETSAANSPMFAMSGDGTDDVKIPVIFLFAKEAAKLREALLVSPGMEVMLGEMKSIGEAIAQINAFNKVPDDIVERSKVNAEDNRETSENSNKYIIKLNDFVAEIIDPFQSPVVELSYKGAFKSDPAVEQTEDTTNISGQELGNSKWKALRKHILQIVQHSKLKVAYTSLTYYFTLVNELDDQSIKKGPVLDVLVRWLLNELEMERDSKSEFIFPSEIYAIALNVKGEEDIKNNVLNLLLNQVRRIEEIQKKLADWKQSDVLINVGNSVMSKVTMNDYLKIMSKYKTHHTISKDEIQEVYDEIISVSDERSNKEKVKNDEL